MADAKDKRSKRLKDASKLIADDVYSLSKGIDLLKEYKSKYGAKFDETVDIVLKLGVDPKQSDQLVRGSIVMPGGLGKTIRVAAFVDDDSIKIAEEAGAKIAGNDALIESIKSGNIDFDFCVSIPSMMPKIASLGKILGPRGLMPNPKLGTVDEDIVRAIKRVVAGQVDYRIDKGGLIHAGIGKLSFENDRLYSNIKALYESVLAAKPAASKGTYMLGGYVSTSHGISIKIDLSSI